MPKVQSISKSNFAWNSLRKEHHIAHVAEKKKYANTTLLSDEVALLSTRDMCYTSFES